MINCSKSFSGVVTHAPWRKGPPQAPYQTAFSVRTAHRNPERDSHKHHIQRSSLFEQLVGARKGQPQTSCQAEFSVRTARRSPKRTATNTIPSGVLCSNSPLELEKDSHKHHTKRSSLFEQPIGTRNGQPQTPYQAEFSVRTAHRSPERAIGDRFHGPPG